MPISRLYRRVVSKFRLAIKILILRLACFKNAVSRYKKAESPVPQDFPGIIGPAFRKIVRKAGPIQMSCVDKKDAGS